MKQMKFCQIYNNSYITALWLVSFSYRLPIFKNFFFINNTAYFELSKSVEFVIWKISIYMLYMCLVRTTNVGFYISSNWFIWSELLASTCNLW